MQTNLHYSVVSDTEGGFSQAASVRYRILYRDTSGVYSPFKNVPPESGGQPVYIAVQAGEAVVLYWLAAAYDAALEALEVYRQYEGSAEFFKIGEVKPEDQGIFADGGLSEGLRLGCTDPITVEYPDGLRCSEAFNPGWYLPENLWEFGSGDGYPATGMAVSYGDLLVFKERSVYRATVQGIDVPITRIDTVSREFGCIAPNTLLASDNWVYFLAHDGFRRYENNRWERADGMFHEELMWRIRPDEQGVISDAVRAAACGYNPVYGEIYLNVPSGGMSEQHGKARILRGHVYVLSLSGGYVTKFEYAEHPAYARSLSSHTKLYYTNSAGELISAEAERPFDNGATFIPSGMFKEAPTDETAVAGREQAHTSDELHEPPSAPQPTRYVRLRALWGSGFFTGERETWLKRLRNVIATVYSEGEIVIRLVSGTDTPDARVADTDASVQQHTFNTAGDAVTGARLQVTPEWELQQPGDIWKDDAAKPLRLAVDVEVEHYGRLDAVSLSWRPVHTYGL